MPGEADRGAAAGRAPIRRGVEAVLPSMDAAVAYRTDLPFARRRASILAMAPDARTDVELLGLIAGGDRPAFEELYRRYAAAKG